MHPIKKELKEDVEGRYVLHVKASNKEGIERPLYMDGLLGLNEEASNKEGIESPHLTTTLAMIAARLHPIKKELKGAFFAYYPLLLHFTASNKEGIERFIISLWAAKRASLHPIKKELKESAIVNTTAIAIAHPI